MGQGIALDNIWDQIMSDPRLAENREEFKEHGENAMRNQYIQEAELMPPSMKKIMFAMDAPKKAQDAMKAGKDVEAWHIFNEHYADTQMTVLRYARHPDEWEKLMCALGYKTTDNTINATIGSIKK